MGTKLRYLDSRIKEEWNKNSVCRPCNVDFDAEVETCAMCTMQYAYTSKERAQDVNMKTNVSIARVATETTEDWRDANDAKQQCAWNARTIRCLTDKSVAVVAA